MNKQEALEKLEKIEIENSFEHWVGYYGAKELIEQIEPEKPIIPQFVADWIEVCKEHLTTSLYTAMNPNFMKGNSQSFDLILWIKKTSNQDIFARAWLDGYEVEKEKLYTARLKLVTFEEESYLKKHCRKDDFSIGNSSEFGNYQTSFTQSELEELNVWDNPAFEIEEKEND